MKYIHFFSILLIYSSLSSQTIGIYNFPEHNGKIISQIIKNKNTSYAILVPFFSDYNELEESNVCEINEYNELINCKKLSDSSFYWNTILAYDSSAYILAGVKTSDIFKIDTLLIEKRDLNFNLLQRFTYFFNMSPLIIPIVKDGDSYHIFLELFDNVDESFLEFVVPNDNDLLKTKLKVHNIGNNIISSIKRLNNTYLAYYLWGLAKTDTSFSNPNGLKPNIIYDQGSIIDAIDSGFVAFGSAVIKNSTRELGIVKYNLNLDLIKFDTFGIILDSWEKPANAYPISKNGTDYFVSAHIGIEPSFYTDTFPNYLFIGKYDKDLNRKWLKKVGGDRRYLVWGVEASSSGGCCIYGLTRSKETNYESIPFMMCVDDEGSLTSVDQPEVPYLDFTLLGNPGGNELKFILGNLSSDVSYQITTINGQMIAIGKGIQGLNTISAADWPTGVYIISFTDKGQLIHREKWVKAF